MHSTNIDCLLFTYHVPGFLPDLCYSGWGGGAQNRRNICPCRANSLEREVGGKQTKNHTNQYVITHLLSSRKEKDSPKACTRGFCLIWEWEKELLMNWHLNWDLKNEQAVSRQRQQKTAFYGKGTAGAQGLRGDEPSSQEELFASWGHSLLLVHFCYSSKPGVQRCQIKCLGNWTEWNLVLEIIIGWRSKDLTSDSSPPGQFDFPTAYHAHIMLKDLGKGKQNKTSLCPSAAQGRVEWLTDPQAPSTLWASFSLVLKWKIGVTKSLRPLLALRVLTRSSLNTSRLGGSGSSGVVASIFPAF